MSLVVHVDFCLFLSCFVCLSVCFPTVVSNHIHLWYVVLRTLYRVYVRYMGLPPLPGGRVVQFVAQSVNLLP